MYRTPNTIHYPRYVTISQSDSGHYTVHRETDSRYDATAALRPLYLGQSVPYMYVYDRQYRRRVFTIGTEV